MRNITRKALSGVGCSADEALSLAFSKDLDVLFESATRIREHHFGKKIELCRIINAKCGSCDMDCGFCSQSAFHSAKVECHAMLGENELLEKISISAESGARHTGIVTSGGRLNPGDVELLCRMASREDRAKASRLCASLGRLDPAAFRALKEAGFSRIHHNLETSREFYPRICSTQSWDDRLATIRAARHAGFEVCSGGLFGMGESWEDRISLALSLRREQVDSVPVNYLDPRPGTPLAKSSLLPAEEGLRIIAVLRHLLPAATLRICGGRKPVLGNRQNEIFAAGANALMTGDYLTTAGRTTSEDKNMIEGAGLYCSES